VQVLHPTQKSELPPFWSGKSWGIKMHGCLLGNLKLHGRRTELKKYTNWFNIIGDSHNDRRVERLYLTFVFKGK
jgi:hypothetical protein